MSGPSQTFFPQAETSQVVLCFCGAIMQSPQLCDRCWLQFCTAAVQGDMDSFIECHAPVEQEPNETFPGAQLPQPMQEHQTQELISLAHQQTSLAHQQTSSLQAGLVYNSLLPSTQAEVPTINHVTLNQSAHGQYAILTDEPEQYEQPLSDGVFGTAPTASRSSSTSSHSSTSRRSSQGSRDRSRSRSGTGASGESTPISRKRLTDEIKRRIKDGRINERMSYQEIADDLKCSKSSAWRIINEIRHKNQMARKKLEQMAQMVVAQQMTQMTQMTQMVTSQMVQVQVQPQLQPQ